MFFNKQTFASVLLAIAMTSVSAAPSQQMSGAVAERDIAIDGFKGGDFHLANGDVDLVSSTRFRSRFFHRRSLLTFIVIAPRSNTRFNSVRWEETLTPVPLV